MTASTSWARARIGGAAVLLALIVGVLVGGGGATGDRERVVLATALCAGAGLVAALARTPDPIARPSVAEAALLGLALLAALQAVVWPDGVARALAPHAWASREAALGVAGGVTPSLDAGATARAALVLASLAFLAAAARVVVARGGLPSLLRALAVVACAHAATALVRGRYGEDDALPFGWVSENPLNAYGTFPNRTQFAAFLLVLLVAPVGLWARPRHALDRPLAAITALIVAASVVASGSRAGALGLVMAGSVVAVSAGGARRGRAALALVAAAVGLFVARSAGFAPLVAVLPLRGDEADRLSIWRGTIDLSLAQPVVGVGLDAFRYAYPGDGRGPIDHWVGIAENDALQLVAEMGLVGVAIAALALAAAVRALRSDRRAAGTDGLAVPVALAGLAALLPLALTSSPLHQPGVAAAAVLGWAAARGLVRGEARVLPVAGGAGECDAPPGREYGSGPSEASPCVS